MQVTLVHNPDAGEGRTSADELLQTIGKAGYNARYQSTKDLDWHKVLDMPADIIAVAGGDGIVGRVAKRCVGRGTPVAVLPLGTANNIARSLGLTDVSLGRLVEDWQTAPRKKIDVAWATGPWGTRAFLEGLGVGLFTEIMLRLDARGNIDLAHLSGEEKIASVQDFLKYHASHYPSFKMKVFLDGRDLSGQFILLEALNTQSVGPNLCLAPDADTSDGLLDLALFYEGQQNELVHQLVENGSTGSPASGTPKVVQRGRLLEVEVTELPVHIDDEIWPELTARPLTSPIELTASVKGDSLVFLGR